MIRTLLALALALAPAALHAGAPLAPNADDLLVQRGRMLIARELRNYQL